LIAVVGLKRRRKRSSRDKSGGAMEIIGVSFSMTFTGGFLTNKHQFKI
jgi:hypothetical protein